MTKSNEKRIVTFAFRAEAIAFRDSITLLAAVYPNRAIRTCGPWETGTLDTSRWAVEIEA